MKETNRNTMKQKTKTYTCQHCGRTFSDAGVWMSHDCDAPHPQPAQRDVVAILDNAPRCPVEEDGDMLWA